MPTVKAGNRICQPITQANCRRDSRTGSRSMVGLLSPLATRRTNAPHPCAQGYIDTATDASPRLQNSMNAWWARQGSNLCPLPCQRSVLPSLPLVVIFGEDSNLQPGRYERTSSAAHRANLCRPRDEGTQCTCEACSSVERVEMLCG